MNPLRRCIAELPPLRGRCLEGLRIEPLGGLTNRNFRLTLDGERYVLRLPGPGSGRRLDRRREAHNTALAAELGLTPAVLYQDPRSGVRLSRHVAGRPLTPQNLREPDTLAAAVDRLARLHRSGAPFRGHIRLFEELDRHIDAAGGSLAAELQRLRTAVEPLRPRLAIADTALRPCHHDPVPENLLLGTDGRLWLLDWEYAGLGDPLWDLATLALEAALDTAGERRLLLRYDGTVDEHRQQRLRLYRGLLDLLAAAWALAEQTAGNTATDFGDYARRCLRRAERTLRSRSD